MPGSQYVELFCVAVRVLQAFSLMCDQKLKSREFKSSDYECEKLMIASNQPCTFAVCADVA